jgi:hypothetical protein
VQRLRTRGDFVMFLGLSVAILALGIAMLLSPLPPLPTDGGAYERVSGVIERFELRRHRRDHRVEFSLQADARRFESRFVALDHASATWQPGVTRLSFHVLRRPPEAPPPRMPVEVYGLADSGGVRSRLDEDVARANQRVSPWAPWIPLTIGTAGLAIAPWVWRRHRVGYPRAAKPARST